MDKNEKTDDKKALRQRMRKLRLALSECDRAVFSCKLAENVLSWEVYRRAANVLIYFPYGGEPDVLRFAEMSPEKRFFMPQIRENHALTLGEYTKDCAMVAGEYGIMEPREQMSESENGAAVDIDLVIAPALACDFGCNRLGQGGGYYDRFLAEMRMRNEKAVFAAVVYDFQMVDKLDARAHDVKMDYVITPSKIIAKD